MTKRIVSIDVMRGMIITLMILVNTPGSWKYVIEPFRHAEWHGCTLTDIVFPGFLFVVGLSMSISFRKYDGKGWQALFLKITKRTALIFGIGLLLNWFPFFHKNIDHLRIFGVLQRIALSFFLASCFLLISKKWKFVSIVSVVLLLVHWYILDQFGVYDPYALNSNVASEIDLWLIGDNHMYHGFGIAFDPEGLLGTLTGAAQILLGYLIGYQVTSREPDNDTITFLVVLGGIFIALGLAWNEILPINKPLWTASYVIYTTGILSVVFYGLVRLIDINQKRGWTMPFQVFGRNPLISYVLSGVIVRLLIYVFKTEETNGYTWLFTKVFQPIFGDMVGSLAFAITMTTFIWLIAYALYRRNIVIKV